VSVIIPACNAGDSIAACLESVDAQTLAPGEVVVVDDGSTDGTADAVRGRWSTAVLLQQENAGQGAARNAGLSAAHGRFVAFLDADDYWRPSFLERCVDFLEARPEAIAVNTAFVVRSFRGEERVCPAAVREGRLGGEARVLEDFFGFWAEHDHVRTGTVVMRHDAVRRAGPQRADLRVSQDLEYWGYLATFGPWGFITEPLWVGNSRASGRRAWRAKYRERRRQCPTVESWQERILPRLTPRQRPAFETVRGRVAAGFAHTKVLAGSRDEARHIVTTYGASMPPGPVTSLMRRGAGAGAAGWWTVCAVIRARERLKAHVLGAMR
jgi:hypothetical protein